MNEPKKKYFAIAFIVAALPAILAVLDVFFRGGDGHEFLLYKLIGINRTQSLLFGIFGVFAIGGIFILFKKTPNHQSNPKTSKFDRHPILTISLILLIALPALLLVTELLLGELSMDKGRKVTGRFIDLREFGPNKSVTIIPKGKTAQHEDLAGKRFTIRTDDNGFIRPSKQFNKSDLDILFLGGSTTENKYMRETERFHAVTSEVLHKEFNLKANTFNAAKSGNTSMHSINILLNKIAPMHPSIVVLMHNINDLTLLIHEKTYWPIDHGRSTIIDIKPRHQDNRPLVSRVGDWLKYPFPNLRSANRNILGVPNEATDEWARTRQNTVVPNAAAIAEAFSRNLKVFIYAACAMGSRPVLMTQPFRADNVSRETFESNPIRNVSYEQFVSLHNLFNDTIRAIADHTNTALIDLARLINTSSEHMYDMVHQLPKGSIAAGKVIAEALVRISKDERSVANTGAKACSYPEL